LTSFVGREQEVAALQGLVKRHRLVTLTGVGGVGKSSLALAVADTLTFPDGVWLLELASITEAGLVVCSLADLFQLPEFPGRTSQTQFLRKEVAFQLCEKSHERECKCHSFVRQSAIGAA
jgi:predicted ATPase